MAVNSASVDGEMIKLATFIDLLTGSSLADILEKFVSIIVMNSPISSSCLNLIFSTLLRTPNVFTNDQAPYRSFSITHAFFAIAHC